MTILKTAARETRFLENISLPERLIKMSCKPGSEINFLIWAPTGEQV